LAAGAQLVPVVETARCPSCGTELVGTYCHRCGEKMFREKDLSLKHFFEHSLHELTHLDSKIFVTLRYLFTRPGFLTQEYVAGRRLHYVKPFSLFLVACAVFLLADSLRPIDPYNLQRLNRDDRSGSMNAAWEKMAAIKHQPKEVVAEQMAGLVHKMGTSTQLANVLAMAAVLSLFYRRRYFTEHLVFACHFLAFNFIALVVLSPLESAALHVSIKPFLLRFFWRLFATNVVPVVYLFFALRRVYTQGAAITVLKAIVTYSTLQFLIFVTMAMTLAIAAAYATLS
jgi:hypothetical protein